MINNIKTCDICKIEQKLNTYNPYFFSMDGIYDDHIKKHDWIKICEIDLCPDCRKNKLLPWLIEMGVSVQC